MRAVCICLPEYPDAIVAAQKHFEESGLNNVEFVWGIHAPTAGLATSHVYEKDHPGSGFRMGEKPTGIWLSHWMTWNCLMRYQDDYFMVLETDAKFEEGWKEKLDQALKDAPTNWDFIYPGSCCTEGHEMEHVAGNVYKTVHIQCTHCYIVARKCLPFLLRTLRKVWAPIDVQLQLECFPYLHTFLILPRLVSQFNTILPP